jgi:cardiolipin synthase
MRIGEDRIVTIPNVISVVRLLCVPVFLWLLFGRDDRLAAGWLLAFLGATDWVDGYIARHHGQVSTVGKVLDPTADRVLLVVGVVALMVDGSVPVWLGVLTLAREVIVSVAVLALAAKGARRIDVQWVGKAGTFALMFAYPMFLLANAGTSVSGAARVVAWGCALPGLALSYYAALTYVPLARQALAEGRTVREVPVP